MLLSPACEEEENEGEEERRRRLEKKKKRRKRNLKKAALKAEEKERRRQLTGEEKKRMKKKERKKKCKKILKKVAKGTGVALGVTAIAAVGVVATVHGVPGAGKLTTMASKGLINKAYKKTLAKNKKKRRTVRKLGRIAEGIIDMTG